MLKHKKLPFIFQSEMAECGLACIAMILVYFGNKISLSQIRRHYKPTLTGMTLHQLKKIAENLGLLVTVIRIEVEQLHTIKLPCIMHWEMNHFMVVKTITRHSMIAHDPARGIRTISMDEVRNAFTGIVLEVEPHTWFVPIGAKVKQSTLLMIDLFKKYGFTLLKLVLISCLIQLFYIGGVTLIQKCIDVSSHEMHYSMIYLFLIGFFGLKLIEFSTTAIRALHVTYAGTSVNHEFGVSVMKHLISLPILFFQNRHTGDILSRFGAIDKIRNTLTEGFVEGLVDGAVSIIILISMYLINYQMTLIVFLSSFLFFVSRLFYNHYARQFQEEALHTRSAELSHFIETIHAMPSIKLFAKESNRLFDWSVKFIRSLNITTRIAWFKTIYDFIKNILYGFDLTLTLAIGCVMLTKNRISLGMLYAFLAYRHQLITSISRLGDKIQDFKLLKLHLDRLDDIVSEPCELSRCCQCTQNDASTTPTLVIENLSYSHSLNDIPLFEKLNFTIHQTECVVITGPSGCGKTTLLKMLMGLLPPTTGKIYYNDKLIYPDHISCYRKSLGAVLQDDVLFSGSISDNISFFDPEINIHKVIQCAELAGIIDDINSFPMRFNTLIGDMGSVLSGGQKQRLLLARALYVNPSILFLDEATSHLDLKKEQDVNQALRSLGITIVMIAHRKETIMMADRIITLNKNNGHIF